MLESDFQKNFEGLTMPWFYSNPLFFKLFCMQKLVENPMLHIPFRVGKNLIEYNPKIIGKKNKDSVRKDLMLELTRIILHHPFRCPENEKDFDIETWYEASTMTITQKGVAFRGFEKNRDIEYYYKKLREKNMDLPFGKGAPFGMSLPDESEEKSSSENESSPSLNFDTNASSFFSEEDSKTAIGKDSESDSNEEKDNKTMAEQSSEKEEGKEEKYEGFAKSETSYAKEDSKTAKGKDSESDSNEEKDNKTMAGQASEKEEGKEEKNEGFTKSENSYAKEGSELWSCNDEEAEKEMDNFMRENNNLWGYLPGHVEELLSLLNAKRAKIPSCIKLLEYFKGIHGNSNYSLTRMRPSRRFGYTQMGKKHRPEPGKILVGIDVSGSIEDEQIIRFYHAIRNVFDRGIKNIEVFQFDSKLKTEKPLPFRKTAEIKVQGRGGTSFQPLFDYAIKNQRNYDGLIIFTDGFAPEVEIHRRFTTKVLWVLNDRNFYCNVNESLSKTGFVTALA